MKQSVWLTEHQCTDAGAMHFAFSGGVYSVLHENI